jgi:DNA topoisomerase-3
MGKIAVLAEKPSVGRDLARVLQCGKKGNGYFEGDRYVVTSCNTC